MRVNDCLCSTNDMATFTEVVRLERNHSTTSEAENCPPPRRSRSMRGASDCVATVFLDESNIIDSHLRNDIPEVMPYLAESQAVLSTSTKQFNKHHEFNVEGSECEASEVMPTPASPRIQRRQPLAIGVPIPMPTTSYSSDYGVLPEASISRPEYLSVTSFQASRFHNDLGIEIGTNRDGQVIITKTTTQEDGIFYKSSCAVFQVGDQIVSVDNASCLGLTVRQTLRLIQDRARRTIRNIGQRQNNRYVTLVVRNQGGDSRIVSSTLIKRHSKSFVGVSVRRRMNGDNKAYVENVDISSPFYDGNNDKASLIHLDDNLLFVNGVSFNGSGIRKATQAMKYSDIVTMISTPTKEERAIMTCQTRKREIRPLQRLFSFCNKRNYNPCQAVEISL